MSSKEILNDIINAFEPHKFIRFFREKSRKFKPIEQSLNNYNNEDFTDGNILGEISFEDSTEFFICIFKVIKPLSERSGKKAQYLLGKKILKEAARYSGGIFIFYDEKKDFRFSLIYDIPLSNGKRDWSSFKRFTYYLSKDQTNKTFIYRLDTADFNSLEKIQEAFSVGKVTKEFYTEIANWYFWALKFVKFPKDAEAEKNGRNIALIRFITRIIFIWFMKQKNLIKNNLFDKNELKNILNSLNDKENTYYKAILQNLFFATLNTPIKERKFRKDHSFQGKNDHYMEHNYYRFHSLFKNPDDMLNIFKDIPFLNGGLFECLDKAKNDPSNDTGEDLSAGASAKAEIRIDGFSDKENNQTTFPNILFFSNEKEVDLNKDFGTNKKKYKTRGLINILQSYNFTIDENTPTDEEIALDPELLGRVFENLLASYNPETASTARKSTGSYYTPREIVNYMVDESLIAYLKNKMIEGAKSYIKLGEQQSDMFGNSTRKGQLLIEEELLPSKWIDKEDALEIELRKLISYSEEEINFAEKEIDILINAINTCKILDPAIGSGAFPMGVLHKLVLILSKLDAHNLKWKQEQISGVTVTDPQIKSEFIKRIEKNFSRNELDYGRKLYLIQNCLYGVDIQPIAIQIAKLRFFISLLVDEKVQNAAGEVDNYGIEPLPNLETKLVAANTLIGLPQTLTLKPREIEKLEKELFDLRRKYFITSSENEKKQLEAKDRELRGKIKAVLEENGFPLEYAEKISAWDPYNTNIASGWFDPEWMFGPEVKEGFDVVIGNPPYVDSEHMVLNQPEQREILNSLYLSTKGNWDLYIPFFEFGYNSLTNKGILSFISPNKWLAIGYGKNLRKILLDSVFRITDCSYIKVFDAGNSPFLSFVKKSAKNKNIIVNYFNPSYQLLFRTLFEKQEIKGDNWGVVLSPHLTLLEKILSLKKSLKSYCSVENPFSTAEAYQLKKIIEDSKECKDSFKLINTGTIDRYLSLWGYKKITYIKNHYQHPIISKHNFNNIFPKRYEQSKAEKLIITGMRHFEVVWDSKGEYIAGKSTLIIRNIYNGLTYPQLLGYLNSNIISFYIKNAYGSLGIDGGINFTADLVENLPFPESFLDINIKNLVIKIHTAKQQNPQSDTKHLEDQIDIMIYKLYNLTYEEVEIIDPRIGNIISKADYDKYEIQ